MALKSRFSGGISRDCSAGYLKLVRQMGRGYAIVLQ